MKKMFITLLLLAFTFVVVAQNNEMAALQTKVTSLESTNAKLNAQLKVNQKAVADLTLQVNSANENIKALQEALAATQQTLDAATGSFDKRISENEKTLADQVNLLVKSIMNNTIYWVIAFLVVALVTFYLYRKMRGRLSNEKAIIYSDMAAGNDSLKADLADKIEKNADNMRQMFTGELMDYADSNRKALDTFSSDYNGRLSRLDEKMESEFKALKTVKPKKQPSNN
jgi:biopolymer transport protein ExbB/TolQ